MEAIGTVAAVAQLLDLSVRTSKAAKGIGQSFLDAPAELDRLKLKLDLLQSRIQQLCDVAKGLPYIDSSFLLPREHQLLISTHLHANLQAFQLIKSCARFDTGKPHTVTNRLRWAMLDKKKTDRLLKQIAEAESNSDTVLAILAVRLASLNQSLLATLSASHTLLHDKLRESTEEIKAWMQMEMQSLIVKSDGMLNPISVDVTPSVDPCQRQQPSRSEHDEIGGNQHSRSRSLSRGSSDAYDIVDPGTRFIQHLSRRSLYQRSISFGSLNETHQGSSDVSRKHASMNVQCKRNRRTIRIVVSIGFRLFCQHVLQFEIHIQQTLRQWHGMPKAGLGVTIFNLRPNDAPIFRACQSFDLQEVRYLLESGQASVYDFEDEIGGLLEHVVQGDYKIRLCYYYLNDECARMQVVLEYLLDQGCDPGMFYGPITRFRLPAVLFAFDRGYSAAVSTLLSRGADIESHGSILAGLFLNTNAGLSWKVDMARRTGYSDWAPETAATLGLPNTILHGACEEGNIQEVLFGLEIAHIDPNLEGVDGSTALADAACSHFFEAAVILIEVGEDVNCSTECVKGTPLIRSLSLHGACSSVTQYLLLMSVDTQSVGPWNFSLWHNIWNIACNEWGNRPTAWSFLCLEGDLSHVLLHGSDPFDFVLELETWSMEGCYRTGLQLRASDIARSWSYAIPPGHKHYALTKERICNFELAEASRIPVYQYEWCHSGIIYQPREEERNNHSWYGLAEGHSPCRSCHGQDSRCQAPSNTGPQDDNEGQLEGPVDLTQSNITNINTSEELQYFGKQTRFYDHLTTVEGRAKLSHFPMVLALCDALQYAGYRAEMDLDGDIWYEDEDGDRYFDALETIPCEENGDALPDAKFFRAVCPICADFPGHGLGHILEEAEEAKRKLYEYRAKVEATKKSTYFY